MIDLCRSLFALTNFPIIFKYFSDLKLLKHQFGFCRKRFKWRFFDTRRIEPKEFDSQNFLCLLFYIFYFLLNIVILILSKHYVCVIFINFTFITFHVSFPLFCQPSPSKSESDKDFDLICYSEKDETRDSGFYFKNCIKFALKKNTSKELTVLNEDEINYKLINSLYM